LSFNWALAYAELAKRLDQQKAGLPCNFSFAPYLISQESFYVSLESNMFL